MSTPRCNETVERDECVVSHETHFVGAYRGRTGGWYLRFDLEATVDLPDGRKVVMSKKRVSVRADRQVGQRPRTGQLHHAQK